MRRSPDSPRRHCRVTVSAALVTIATLIRLARRSYQHFVGVLSEFTPSSCATKPAFAAAVRAGVGSAEIHVQFRLLMGDAFAGWHVELFWRVENPLIPARVAESQVLPVFGAALTLGQPTVARSPAAPSVTSPDRRNTGAPSRLPRTPSPLLRAHRWLAARASGRPSYQNRAESWPQSEAPDRGSTCWSQTE
jgi:hypothetical protein